MNEPKALRAVFLLLALLLPACGVGGSGTLTPTVAPAAPESLTTRSGFGRLVLTWAASPAATRYVVRRSTTSGGPYLDVLGGTVSSGTTFIDSSVTNGTTYFYAIVAVNDFGESAPSKEIAAAANFKGVSVAAGTWHSLALLEDGTLWAWGQNSYGQLGDATPGFVSSVAVPITALTGASAIGVGYFHSLAVHPDGTVWTWGKNDNGALGDNSGVASRNTPAPASGLTGVVAVAGGRAHSMALKADGTVWAWGKAMGPGGTDSGVPVPVGGLSNIIKIAAAGGQCFALRSDGSVWAWGLNSDGQLGLGVAGGPVATPTQVANLGDVVDVAAGEFHGIALRSDGTVWTWGRNASGELGDGTTTPSSFPQLVPPVHGASSVTAASGASLVVLSDGSIMGWGGTSALGLIAGPTPSTFPGLSNIRVLAAGEHHSIAIETSGKIWAWGDNFFGELGSGTGAIQPLPLPVANLGSVAVLSSGPYHSLALLIDGSVWGWGGSAYGAIGPVTTAYSPFRTSIPGFSGAPVTTVAAGGDQGIGNDFSLALRSDGTILAWGNNLSGQLGTASVANQTTTPTPVDNLTGATLDTKISLLSAGSLHSVALAASGIAWTWGDNFYGQLGNNSLAANSKVPVQVSGLAGATAVAAGVHHCLAIVGSGPSSTVWAWGANDSGQLGYVGALSRVPVQVAGLSGVTAIAAGHYFSLALKDDGTVWAWGGNLGGELGDGSASPPSSRATPAPVYGLAGVTAIAVGDRHALARRTDGTVWSWGQNNSGQLGNPQGVSNMPGQVVGLTGATQIAAGGQVSFAVLLDGTARGWGWNNQGQLGIGTVGFSSTPILVTH